MNGKIAKAPRLVLFFIGLVFIDMKRNVLLARQLNTLPIGEYRDGAGLCFVVSKNSKTWVLRYSIEKTRNALTIGKFPFLTLAEARFQSEKALQNLKKGIHPNNLKYISDVITFREAIDLWLPVHLSKVIEKTANESLRRLEIHSSSLMDRSIDKITPLDINKSVQLLIADRKFETANKVTDNIRQVFEHVRILGLVTTNPANGIKSILPKHQVKSFPAIHHDNLWLVFKAMYEGRQSKQSIDLMSFHILSGLRCSEVVSAKWSGLNDNKLTIESQYMKGKKDKKQSHDVMLCDIAKEILNRQPKISEYIFPKRGKPLQHVSSEWSGKWLRDNGFQGKLVAHGFRSVFSTWANSQKQPNTKLRLFDKEIIELCLAHKVSNVQSIYDRNEYDDDKLDVMIGWGSYVKDCMIKAIQSVNPI
jgi:integrase